MILLLCHTVWATPLPLAAEGTLMLEGHGRTPGEISEHPVVANLFDHDDGLVGQWVGAGWTETIAIRGVKVWRLEDKTWVEVSEGRDRAALKALAVSPEHLLERLEREPFRARTTRLAHYYALSEGMARVEVESGRLTALFVPRAHPVFGDVVDEMGWVDGEIQIAMADDDVRWTVQLRATAASEVPDLPPLPSRALHSSEIAPSTHVISVPEANSRVLLHHGDTEGVLFDVPLNSAIGTALWEESKRIAPGIETWFVVVSHHHPHYSGGLRPWARAGATIVVHPELEAWVRALLQQERMFDPSDPAVADPRIQVVGKKTELLGGDVHLRKIDDASGHTDAFVMSFLPGPKILYVADLASHATDAERARFRGEWPAMLSKWKPEKVVSGWPLEGTMEVWDFAGGLDDGP